MQLRSGQMPELLRHAHGSCRHSSQTSSSYIPHRPEETLLHQTLREHLETFLARARERDHPAPRFVERELRGYLACGVLAHGVLRLHCDACGCDRLVPFSCKGRGFCPSCGRRRMADTAAHLVDRVLPEVPVRQWVLSLPFALRYRLAYDAQLTSHVLRLFIRALFASLRRRARAQWRVSRGFSGAITFVQRFGSALNLNLHFHSLALDGVYEIRDGSAARFHPLPPPDDGEMGRLVDRIARHLERLLARKGFLPDADPTEADPLAEQEPLLAALAAASVRGRVATGPRTGQRLRRLGDRVDPEASELGPGSRCASAGGLSLHANVAVPARDRRRLERLCRYVARPPLATERLTRHGDGRLCYRLKQRWRDGTTHVLLEPLELLERLAPIVPPPRSHWVRYHGILAPCASWRDRVVPAGPKPIAVGSTAVSPREANDECAAGSAATGPIRIAGNAIPRNDKQVATDAGSGAPACPPRPPLPRPRRLPWAELLQRVFDVDAFACPRCGGRLRLLAAIESPDAIHAILDCLGLPSRAPPLAPAERLPLEGDFEPPPAFEE